MATRALIGYLNDDNTITTTYNHYDGYPENLGVALDRHYNTDAKAKEIANMGYVSFVEPVNGDIEANNQDSPVTIGDDDLISSLQFLKKESDGVDYVYLFSPSVMGGEWLTSKTSLSMDAFLNTFLDDITDAPDVDDVDFSRSDESYQSKFAQFLNEENIDNRVIGDTSIVIARAETSLEDEPNLDIYIDSLTNDIRLNGDDVYLDFNDDDWKEDFQNYIANKMDY